MKKLLKSTAALALLFVTTTGMANEPKISLTSNNDTKSVVLKMDAPAFTSEVRLTDIEGRLLHYESISAGTYAKKFNLQNLKAGTYLFTVDNPAQLVAYTLTVKNDEIKIGVKDKYTRIPVLRRSGSKIYLNMINQNRNNVKVSVLNGDNKLLDSRVFKGDLTIGKVYNFENALADNYSVVVKHGKDVYRQNILIE